MHSSIRPLLTGGALGLLLAQSALASSPPPTLATAQQTLAAPSVSFVPNVGQWDARAAFGAKTFAGALFVTKTGELVYSLPAANPLSPGGRGVGERGQVDGSAHAASQSAVPLSPTLPRRGGGSQSAWSLTETLVDPQGQPRTARLTQGIDPTPTRVSFHTTDAVAAHTNGLNAYARVNLGEMYPGVNVELKAAHTTAGNNVEKIFTVAPHHDPKQIQIKLSGAQALEINAKGELIAHTGNGPVAFTAPIAFQEDDKGARIPVEVAYQLLGAQKIPSPAARERVPDRAGEGVRARTEMVGAPPPPSPQPSPALQEREPEEATPSRRLHSETPDTYTFTVGTYDPTRPLVIDPLLASTYLGGAGIDQISAMAIHPTSGEVYVVGYTVSTGFPQSSGGGQPSGSGQSCFVSRYSADLSRLIQSSYVGNGDVRCTSLAFTPSGDAVYVAGLASGTSTLPNTTGAIQTTHANAGNFSRLDGFVARLSADLRILTKATFFGGSGTLGSEQINAIAVHPLTGLVHIVGSTDSATLPGTAVGSQSTFGGGGVGAFTARLPADLMGPAAPTVRYTFIAGNNTDNGNALAIDPRSGDVLVAGYTGGGLPAAMLVGAAQATYAGNGDAFVARLKQDLSAVVRATYFGGGGFDGVTSLALHPLTGEVVIAGYSSSTAPTALPNVAGGAQSANVGGNQDGFVSRLSADLTTIGQTSYFGGGGSECQGTCPVAIHPQSGEVFVAGDTDAALPAALVANGYQTTYRGGSYDAFVLRFNAALTQRRGGTHLGGNGIDAAYALAIEPNGGSVYVAGFNNLGGFPTTPGALQGTAPGSGDAFISRFSTDLAAENRIPNPFSFIPQSNVLPNTVRTSNEVRLTITPTPPDNQQTAYVTGAAGSELCMSNQPGICTTPPAACTGGCFTTGWFPGPWDFLSGDYIAVRHTSANPSGTAETKLIISGQAYPFRTSTGNANIACNLDMNGDNQLSSTVEGLILVRAMLGFPADAIVAGTGVFPWDPVRRRLNEFCGTNFPFSPSNFN